MWLLRGLKKGILTTRFPREEDTTIPLSFYPVNYKDCPLYERMDKFRCMSCGYCGQEMHRERDSVEVKKALPLKRSIHIFVLDVGSCGACNREISLLAAPQYDFHRLGFFTTPTPKHADVLFVVGALTEEMKPVLKEAYSLMPDSKAVIALGVCASESKDIEDIVPLAGRVSGCPPQPISILESLLKIAGRWNQ